MGPIFHKNILEHGFLNFQKANTQKLWKIGLYFEKILKNGYLFLSKWAVNMGKGFEARASDLRPNQIWVPPGGDTYAMRKKEILQFLRNQAFDETYVSH